MIALLKKSARSIFLIVNGLVIIVLIGLAVLYFQNASNQNGLWEQIAQIKAVVAKPLASMDKLRADYKIANEALTVTSSQIVLEKIKATAAECGIDVNQNAGTFIFNASGAPKIVKVGKNSYQAIPFNGIQVKGEYKNVMEFVNKIDGGYVLSTLVLKNVVYDDLSTEELNDAAIKEYGTVLAAIQAMMRDNQLVDIPNPVAALAGGIASNDMGTFPDSISGWASMPHKGKITDPSGKEYYSGERGRTDGAKFWDTGDKLVANGEQLVAEGNNLITEGDRMWSEGDKLWYEGYNLGSEGEDLMAQGHELMAEGVRRRMEGGAKVDEGRTSIADGEKLWEEGDALWLTSQALWEEGDKVGFVLYKHDNKANGSKATLVNYIPVINTKYFYTCEANGVLHQFDGPDIKNAKEFVTLASNVSGNAATRVTLDLELYTLAPVVTPTKTPVASVTPSK